MNVTTEQVSFRGKLISVPAVSITGKTVVATGRWLKTAKFNDEEWVQGQLAADPEALIRNLRQSGLTADVLTFPGPLDTGSHLAGFASRPDNVAVIATSDYTAWWEGLPQEARKNTRRAAKKGIVIRSAVLDEAFVRGIKSIYDETPLRQGRPFWHYGKDLETIRRENSSYLDRSEFIGAYLGEELVGFMKWVYVDTDARIMQILCLNAHQDKRPIIALINRAAEICHAKNMRYLIYGKFTYGKKVDSSITEFKRRLGFTELEFPRYTVALSLKGRTAMALGLHAGLREVLPAPVTDRLLAWRSRYLDWRIRQSSASPKAVMPKTEKETAT